MQGERVQRISKCPRWYHSHDRRQANDPSMHGVGSDNSQFRAPRNRIGKDKPIADVVVQ